jgi:hypothetical protein
VGKRDFENHLGKLDLLVDAHISAKSSDRLSRMHAPSDIDDIHMKVSYVIIVINCGST